MSRWGLVLLVALCCWLAGCGVPVQERPEDVRLPSTQAMGSEPPAGALTATVFLADDTSLVPVERATAEVSPRASLSLLASGPTTAEAEAGLRSALVPGSLDVTMLDQGPRVRGGVAEVAVTDSFTRTAGDDQLLATAQLVWTVTDHSSVRWVHVVVSGRPIELPTDTGLTDAPVNRDDYGTVSPEPLDPVADTAGVS